MDSSLLMSERIHAKHRFFATHSLLIERTTSDYEMKAAVDDAIDIADRYYGGLEEAARLARPKCERI